MEGLAPQEDLDRGRGPDKTSCLAGSLFQRPPASHSLFCPSTVCDLGQSLQHWEFQSVGTKILSHRCDTGLNESGPGGPRTRAWSVFTTCSLDPVRTQYPPLALMGREFWSLESRGPPPRLCLREPQITLDERGLFQPGYHNREYLGTDFERCLRVDRLINTEIFSHLPLSLQSWAGDLLFRLRQAGPRFPLATSS